jgi:hypothetical protein
MASGSVTAGARLARKRKRAVHEAELYARRAQAVADPFQQARLAGWAAEFRAVEEDLAERLRALGCCLECGHVLTSERSLRRGVGAGCRR